MAEVLTGSSVALTPFRERVIAAWRGMKEARKDKDPIIKQKTYRSTLPVTWTISDVSGTAATAQLAPIPDNALQFFSYGISDQIPNGMGTNVKATGTDTNQSKGKNTNGGEVVGIEAVSMACVGMGVKFAQADLDASSLSVATKNMLNGSVNSAIVRDPAALFTPPQFDSPANLENPWMDTWASSTTFIPQFDTSTQTPLGALDEAGEGGARSYLKSHGDPSTHNKYRLPDGLLWLPEGEDGSDFVLLATPTHPLLTILSNPKTLPGAGSAVFPQQIVMFVAVKLACFCAQGAQPNQG